MGCKSDSFFQPLKQDVMWILSDFPWFAKDFLAILTKWSICILLSRHYSHHVSRSNRADDSVASLVKTRLMSHLRLRVTTFLLVSWIMYNVYLAISVKLRHCAVIYNAANRTRITSALGSRFPPDPFLKTMLPSSYLPSIKHAILQCQHIS